MYKPRTAQNLQIEGKTFYTSTIVQPRDGITVSGFANTAFVTKNRVTGTYRYYAQQKRWYLLCGDSKWKQAPAPKFWKP